MAKTFSSTELYQMDQHLKWLRSHRDMPKDQLAKYVSVFASMFRKVHCDDKECKNTHVRLVHQTADLPGMPPGTPLCAIRVFGVSTAGTIVCQMGRGVRAPDEPHIIGETMEKLFTPEQLVEEVSTDAIVEGIERNVFEIVAEETANVTGLFSTFSTPQARA